MKRRSASRCNAVRSVRRKRARIGTSHVTPLYRLPAEPKQTTAKVVQEEPAKEKTTVAQRWGLPTKQEPEVIARKAEPDRRTSARTSVAKRFGAPVPESKTTEPTADSDAQRIRTLRQKFGASPNASGGAASGAGHTITRALRANPKQ